MLHNSASRQEIGLLGRISGLDALLHNIGSLFFWTHGWFFIVSEWFSLGFNFRVLLLPNLQYCILDLTAFELFIGVWFLESGGPLIARRS